MKLHSLTFDPANYNNRQISVQPELLVAFLHKRSIAGRLWLALKYLDTQGGVLPLDYIKEACCDKTKQQFYLMTYGNLLKILHRFNGKFWHFENDRIVIFGPAKIANYFELDKFAFNPVWFHTDQIFTDLKYFNAACYAGYITTLGDMPTSRDKITQETGITKSSQIRYEKLADIEVEAAVVIKDFHGGKNVFKERRQTNGVAVTPVYLVDNADEIGGIDDCNFIGERIGNVRSCNRMLKSTGGRNRRRINKHIESVYKGRRNKHVPYDTVEGLGKINSKGIVNERGSLKFWCNGMIKQIHKFKEVLKKDFSVRRYAVLSDMRCQVYFAY